MAPSGFGPKQQASSPAVATKAGYAPVNGLRMYYEMHGSGAPLILLHGGLGSTAMFSEIMPALSTGRQVIAVDLQAHGRTGDIDRPISFDYMADDIAALLKYLQIEKADVMGFSMGGCTALRTMVRHPSLVRKLVVVSSPCKRNGWYPEIRAAMDRLGPAMEEQMKQMPLYQDYLRVAPRPQGWTTLLVKVGILLRKDYDWSKEVQAIQAPAMLVFGDADAVPPSHAVEFFQLLGGGKKDAGWDGSGISKARLALLPGVTHYTMNASPALPPVVTPFLDAPIPANS